MGRLFCTLREVNGRLAKRPTGILTPSRHGLGPLCPLKLESKLLQILSIRWAVRANPQRPEVSQTSVEPDYQHLSPDDRAIVPTKLFLVLCSVLGTGIARGLRLIITTVDHVIQRQRLRTPDRLF